MLASVFAVSALVFAGSAAAHCSRTYTAAPGDICDSISAAQNVSTYQFATVNYGIIDAECNNLEPGKSYCLGWKGADCSTTTVVKAGDTCELIQNSAGINATLLHLNNPQINQECDNIYIGEVLCTAKTVQVPEAPAGALPVTAIPATATPAITSYASTTTLTPSAPTTFIAVAAPTTTPATVVSSSSSSAAPATTPTDDADDDDDDDVPFCDEL